MKKKNNKTDFLIDKTIRDRYQREATKAKVHQKFLIFLHYELDKYEQELLQEVITDSCDEQITDFMLAGFLRENLK